MVLFYVRYNTYYVCLHRRLWYTISIYDNVSMRWGQILQSEYFCPCFGELQYVSLEGCVSSGWDRRATNVSHGNFSDRLDRLSKYIVHRYKLEVVWRLNPPEMLNLIRGEWNQVKYCRQVYSIVDDLNTTTHERAFISAELRDPYASQG